MSYIEHEFHITVRDIDQETNLTNKAILSMFEDMGGLHSDLAGYGLKQIEETRISWVLLHWKFKILKHIKYIDGPIKVKTWSRGLFHACTYRDFELYNSKGELCVVGTSKWTLIHLEKGLTRITDDILDKYTTETRFVLDEELSKLREPEEIINIYNYTVQRSDIDINNHMHNLRYLDLAYEALPENIYNNTTTFNNVEIMYKKGATLGTNLNCYYTNLNNEHIVTIKGDDNKTLHAIVKLF